jgi:hypothetical protein
VLGAWVYCFRKPIQQNDLDTIKETLKAVKNVIERACGYAWDGSCLAVAMPQSQTPHLSKSFEEWEDLCREQGFEFVDAEARGRNEFGEPVGFQRVKEALEANDWAGDDVDAFDELGIDDEGDEEEFDTTFTAEEAEMNMELMGLKTALIGGDGADEETQVEELERMMLKLQAIKGISNFLFLCFIYNHTYP